jgi:hypothetical protein
MSSITGWFWERLKETPGGVGVVVIGITSTHRYQPGATQDLAPVGVAVRPMRWQVIDSFFVSILYIDVGALCRSIVHQSVLIPSAMNLVGFEIAETVAQILARVKIFPCMAALILWRCVGIVYCGDSPVAVKLAYEPQSFPDIFWLPIIGLFGSIKDDVAKSLVAGDKVTPVAIIIRRAKLGPIDSLIVMVFDLIFR